MSILFLACRPFLFLFVKKIRNGNEGIARQLHTSRSSKANDVKLDRAERVLEYRDR